MTAPRLTVGVPLYNNAETVERALASLLAQTAGELRILASDDGSTDDTCDRVRKLAATDGRIELVTQPQNLNYGNFRFVAQRAETPYFMFAAGDDWWEPTFVERCLGTLEASPEAVCAVSRVRFHERDGTWKDTPGTAPLTGTVVENLVSFLRFPSCNSRMYGIFRADVARRAFPERNYHAYDFAFTIRTLLYGQHLEIPDVLLHRDKTQVSTYRDYVRRDLHRVSERLFPLLPMTRDLLGDREFPKDTAVLRALGQLNWQHHLAYTERFHPRYFATMGAALHRVLWRL